MCVCMCVEEGEGCGFVWCVDVFRGGGGMCVCV